MEADGAKAWIREQFALDHDRYWKHRSQAKGHAPYCYFAIAVWVLLLFRISQGAGTSEIVGTTIIATGFSRWLWLYLEQRLAMREIASRWNKEGIDIAAARAA